MPVLIQSPAILIGRPELDDPTPYGAEIIFGGVVSEWVGGAMGIVRFNSVPLQYAPFGA